VKSKQSSLASDGGLAERARGGEELLRNRQEMVRSGGWGGDLNTSTITQSPL